MVTTKWGPHLFAQVEITGGNENPSKEILTRVFPV